MTSEMKVVELSADKKTYGLALLLSGGCGIHGFLKEFKTSIRLTTKQFSTLPQYILNEL